MKTVTMIGADGREYDVSRAAKSYVREHQIQRTYQARWDAGEHDPLIRDCVNESALMAYTIATTVNDLLGPRKRQAFVKAVEAVYGDLP